jgi:hypothetical protein
MLASGTSSPYPFWRATPDQFTSHRYDPGTLPNTDDILSRSVALTVGLSDTYTGAHFGVNAFSGTDEVAAVAEKFQAQVDEVLG